MFDLEQEITRWRQTMAAAGVDDPAVLDELESHLRDYIAQHLKEDVAIEQVFRQGTVRIGQPSELKSEFEIGAATVRCSRVIAILADWRKSFRASVLLATLAALGWFAWGATATPRFEAHAAIQLLRRPSESIGTREQVMQNDIRTAEDLNSALRMLESNRLRAEVAASLTPAERKIVGRIAAAKPWQGDKLGFVRVIPQRLSLVVFIAVVHEDPEAAALVANRYAEQAQRFLAPPSGLNAMSIRLVDPAVAPRQPFEPNLTRLLILSLMLGLVILALSLLIAAALRKLLRTPTDLDPQMRFS